MWAPQTQGTVSFRVRATPRSAVQASIQRAAGDGSDMLVQLREDLAYVHRQLQYCWDVHHANSHHGAARCRPAIRAHAVCVEDATVHVLIRNLCPLFASPRHEVAIRQWQLGSEAFDEYQREVFAAAEAFLRDLSAEAIHERLDLTQMGLGRPTVGWVIARFVVRELARVCCSSDRAQRVVMSPRSP
jgi:hypothetical protein